MCCHTKSGISILQSNPPVMLSHKGLQSGHKTATTPSTHYLSRSFSYHRTHKVSLEFEIPVVFNCLTFIIHILKHPQAAIASINRQITAGTCANKSVELPRKQLWSGPRPNSVAASCNSSIMFHQVFNQSMNINLNPQKP